MKKFYLIFLVFPFCLFAVENEVPLGTKGNKLSFTIKNPVPFSIHDIRVAVQSCPDWIAFDQTEFQVDSIDSNGRREVEFHFQVLNGEAGRTGAVRLAVRDENGKILTGRTIHMKTILSTNEIKLFPPYPNPANLSVTLQYTLPEAGQVEIIICNVLGQTIRTLLNEEKPAGQWNVQWNGKDNVGETVSSGIYLVRFQTTVKDRTNQITSKIMIQK